MAQRTEIVFTDDLDGSPADSTVKFSVDGTTYEIDLNSEHSAELEKILQPFVSSARKVGSTARRQARSSRPSGPSPSEVRDWAKSQGIAVKDRGRVPQELVVKFKAAQ